MAVNPSEHEDVEERVEALRRDVERLAVALAASGRSGARPRSELGDRFAAEVAALVDDQDLDDEVIRRAARLAVAEQAWQQRLGTLLQTRDVVELLGVSRQRVSTLAGEHRLIALATERSGIRYPAWQFKLTPVQRARAATAHRLLVDEGHVSPWTAASWLMTRHEDIDAGDPAAAIAAGDVEQVLAAARRDAWRLSQ